MKRIFTKSKAITTNYHIHRKNILFLHLYEFIFYFLFWKQDIIYPGQEAKREQVGLQKGKQPETTPQTGNARSYKDPDAASNAKRHSLHYPPNDLGWTRKTIITKHMN